MAAQPQDQEPITAVEYSIAPGAYDHAALLKEYTCRVMRYCDAKLAASGPVALATAALECATAAIEIGMSDQCNRVQRDAWAMLASKWTKSHEVHTAAAEKVRPARRSKK